MPTRKRTYLLILLAALLAIGVGTFFWNLPRIRVAWGWDHRPKARLHVASHPQAIAFRTEDNPSPNVEANYRRFVKTQMAMLKSRQVINSALLQPGVSMLDAIKRQDDPISWMLDHLEVTNPEDTEVLEVALAAGSGVSDEDQAKLMNAVTRAYFDVVVNSETSMRKSRLDTLKKLANTYHDLARTRRETLRRLAAAAGGDKSTVLQAQFDMERHHDLQPMQLKFWVEQAGLEAILERRKKSEDAATDQGRREIAKVEDQLAALVAQQKAVQSELTRLEHSTVVDTDDPQDLQDELKQIEESSRKINTEIEMLNVELQAPLRIRLIEDAQPASTETVAASLSGRSQ